MKNAVEERHVAARLDRQKKIAGASNRRNARIDDNDLRTELARLPDIVGSNRRALAISRR
jgi:hypothetical protein